MTNISLLFVLSLTINLFFTGEVFPQTEKDGSEVLAESEKLYKEGRADNIHNMLKPYLESGLTRKETKEAYRLIVLAYLFDDNKQEATKVLRQFMKYYPEFDTTKNDPNDLKYLYRLKGFDTKIVFSFGPVIGMNNGKPSTIETFSAGGNTESVKLIHSELQPTFGLQMNARVVDYVDVRLDALYNKNKFDFEQVIDPGETTEYEETLTQLTFPFWIAPYYPIKKHRVYLKLGGGVNYTMKSSADITYTQEGNPPFILSRNNQDVTNKRNAMNYFLGGGFGFSVKIPKAFVTFDLAYLNGLNNIVDESSRDFDDEIALNNYYVDDDFSLNQMMFSVSLVYQFYKLKDEK